jgi:hypothetical protein
MRRVHRLDIGTDPAPQFRHPLDRRRIGIGGRGDDRPAALEQGGKARFRPAIFGAGHRMRRNDDAAGQGRIELRQHVRLARTHVADDRVARQLVGNLRRRRAHRADRHAQYHQFGVGDGCAGRIGDVVAQVDAPRGLAHVRIGIMAGDADGRHIFADRPRQRGSDQAKADDGDTGKGQHRVRPPPPWRAAWQRRRGSVPRCRW